MCRARPVLNNKSLMAGKSRVFGIPSLSNHNANDNSTVHVAMTALIWIELVYIVMYVQVYTSFVAIRARFFNVVCFLVLQT